MPTLPKPFRAHGRSSPKDVQREADRRRGSARDRGYTTAWDKASRGHLSRSPLCIYCAMGAWGEEPRDQAAALVDHLIPHKGDQDIFWNNVDWVSCCADCHSGPKQATERRPAALQLLANAVRAFLAAARRVAADPGG